VSQSNSLFAEDFEQFLCFILAPVDDKSPMTLSTTLFVGALMNLSETVSHIGNQKEWKYNDFSSASTQ
jgi:hypothetical protein